MLAAMKSQADLVSARRWKTLGVLSLALPSEAVLPHYRALATIGVEECPS
jgi:hypothetical protein